MLCLSSSECCRSVVPLIERECRLCRRISSELDRTGNFERAFFFFLVCLVGLTKDLREDLLLLLVWVVTIGELSILQCTVNNTTTNTLIHKQQTKRSGGCSMMSLMTRSERRQRIGERVEQEQTEETLCIRRTATSNRTLSSSSKEARLIPPSFPRSSCQISCSICRARMEHRER